MEDMQPGSVPMVSLFGLQSFPWVQGGFLGQEVIGLEKSELYHNHPLQFPSDMRIIPLLVRKAKRKLFWSDIFTIIKNSFASKNSFSDNNSTAK